MSVITATSWMVVRMRIPTDPPEVIRKCLSCTKPKCDNCVDGSRGHFCIPVAAFDAKTGEFVASYPSMRSAAKAIDGRAGKISRAVSTGCRYKGFCWRSV